MSYPSADGRLDAEEYELSEAGPSQPRPSTSASPQANKRSRRRTFTLHPNASSSHVLFNAPNDNAVPLSPRYRHVKRPDSPINHMSPSLGRNPWATFLTEDVDQHMATQGNLSGDRDREGRRTEEIHHIPDFGHMLGFNPEDEDHYAVANSMRSPWKRRLYLLMEEPRSGREAFFVHVFVTGAILFSAILTTLSTMPTFHTSPSSIRMLFGLDTTIIVIFTIEYFARSLAHSDSFTQYRIWVTSFFPILDLIAILPYYIEVSREEDTSILFRFSILRTFRLLRVFRAFKYQNQMLLTIEVMYVAVQRSKDALVAISFFILLVLVLFSTLIYFAERGTWDINLGAFVDADGDPSLFDSIPQTAWFALVTMSTVGYGDVVPRSFLGKVLTVPLLMFGLLLIALPSFVLGRNFAITFDEMASTVAAVRRASIDDLNGLPLTAPPPQTAPISSLTANTDESSAPLLLPSASPSGRPTPIPGSDGVFGPAIESANHSGRSTPVPPGPSRSPMPPKMWDGDVPASSSSRGREKDRERDGRDASATREGKGRGDLTNVKLAKNQVVMLEQIESLRKTIDRQGDMINRLLELVAASNGGKSLAAGDFTDSLAIGVAGGINGRKDGESFKTDEANST